MQKRAAIYVRVSTDKQTVENQTAKLTEIAHARGWVIVATFNDAGISGPRAAGRGRALMTCSSRRSGAHSMWSWPGALTVWAGH